MIHGTIEIDAMVNEYTGTVYQQNVGLLRVPVVRKRPWWKRIFSPWSRYEVVEREMRIVVPPDGPAFAMFERVLIPEGELFVPYDLVPAVSSNINKRKHSR